MTQRSLRAALVCLLCLCFLLPSGLIGCQEKPAVGHNEVVSVVTDGKGNITVTAVLTNGFLDSYKEKKVYLFEIPASYAADVNLVELDPIAEVKPKDKITFKVTAADGMRSRLYSSFLVASYDSATRRYTALTFPKFVTDLSDMATSNGGMVVDRAIKGLVSDHPADAIRLGISHTVVNVHMEKLILNDWQEGAVSYVWNGTTAYLHADELAKLDETVKAYTSAGVNVYLRFVLGEYTEHTPLALYFLMNIVEDMNPAEAYAVNMTNSTAVEIMEGFFDFMANRYATPSDGSMPVTSFILGYRVNHESVYNYAGNLPLDDYVTNYEKLVRVANTAIKSHTSDGRVYIALDSSRIVPTPDGHWDIPAFLSAFNNECMMGGNYDWYPSCELSVDTTSVWVADADDDARNYTVQSLGTLTDLLTGNAYRTPDGEQRKLLVSGMSIPAVLMGGTPSHESDLCQAASYAYAYMTCVQNGSVEALIYDSYADSAETAETEDLCGIWTVKQVEENCVIADRRPLYDTFKQVDTSDAVALSDDLTAIIGEPFTKLERMLAGGSQPVTVVRGSGELKSFATSHGKALPLFSFDQGTLHGFKDAGELTYLELYHAETLNSAALYARFDRSAVSDPMGITATVPATRLMGGEDLILDLYAGFLPDPAVSSDSSTRQKPSVTLRLTRHAKGAASQGDGEMIYEASVRQVKDGVWQTAVFDVEEFTAQLDMEDEVTLTLLLEYDVDGNLYSANHLGLAGIYVTGDVAASQASPLPVIAVVVALVALVVGVFVFLLVRHKKKY